MQRQCLFAECLHCKLKLCIPAPHRRRPIAITYTGSVSEQLLAPRPRVRVSPRLRVRGSPRRGCRGRGGLQLPVPGGQLEVARDELLALLPQRRHGLLRLRQLPYLRTGELLHKDGTVDLKIDTSMHGPSASQLSPLRILRLICDLCHAKHCCISVRCSNNPVCRINQSACDT